MQTQLIRTDVQLNSQLFKRVKLKMIDERMSYRQKDKNGLGANISGRIRPKKYKKI